MFYTMITITKLLLRLRRQIMIYNNYEYFLEIVKHRNISKAANELYISQPALSNYLKRLESKLGSQLFLCFSPNN